MKSQLEWWEELAFLSPQARLELGHLVEQLERGLTTTSHQGPPDSPDGWNGISRRGPWDRLIPSEWALAETSPEEFARRADEGELAFWDLAQEQGDATRSIWVWLDVGPDQLGACRVVQIALLLWLQKSCLASGGNFYWGVIQEPEKGYENLGAEELTSFLAARSLDPPSSPPERLDTVQTWCIGSPNWIAGTPAQTVGVSLQQTGLDSVALVAQGRQLKLQMPHHRRAIALLREPVLWQVPRKSQVLEAPRGRFVFNPSGQKIIVATDERILLLPIPSSTQEPLGNPKSYELPWRGEVVAVSMQRRAIHVVQERGEEWIFYLLNPGQAEQRYESVVPALKVGKELGSCWLRNNRWRLWLEDSYYEYSGGELTAPSPTRGGIPLGAHSIIANHQGLGVGKPGPLNYAFDELIPHYVHLARSQTCRFEKLGLALAFKLDPGRWRLHYGERVVNLVVDGEVVGLYFEDRADSEPMLVIHKDGQLLLRGGKGVEVLDVGNTIRQCRVHPNGLLAFRTEADELCCYNLHLRARLWVAQP